jgi:hypothetical protein
MGIFKNSNKYFEIVLNIMKKQNFVNMKRLDKNHLLLFLLFNNFNERNKEEKKII